MVLCHLGQFRNAARCIETFSRCSVSHQTCPGLYLSRKGKPLLNDHIFSPRLDLECAHIGAQRKACPRHPKSVADMPRIQWRQHKCVNGSMFIHTNTYNGLPWTTAHVLFFKTGTAMGNGTRDPALYTLGLHARLMVQTVGCARSEKKSRHTAGTPTCKDLNSVHNTLTWNCPSQPTGERKAWVKHTHKSNEK